MDGITFEKEIVGTKGITAKLTLFEIYDIQTNTHKIAVTDLQLKSSGYYGIIYYLGAGSQKGYIAANGARVVEFDNTMGTHSVLPGLNEYAPVVAGEGNPEMPWSSGEISGNSDGACTITVSVDFYGYSASGKGANGFRIQSTFEVPLTTIPRASAIGAADANIGSVSTVIITKRLATYVHTLAFTFGDLSGYLQADGTISETPVIFSESNVAFLIPESFYLQIPDAPSGICTLTLTTYADAEQIGDPQTAVFTVTASPKLCAPEVSAIVEDIDEITLALTGDRSKMVRFHSDAICIPTVAARNGAAIVSVAVNGQQLQGDDLALTVKDTETGTFVVTATDTRGYTTALEVVRDLIPYDRITCNGSIKRTDPTSGNAILKVSGAFWQGNFGAAENQLTLTYSIDHGQAQTISPVMGDGGYSAELQISGLSYDAEHTVTVTAQDLADQASAILKVQKGIPIFDWGVKDFAFHVPVKMEHGFTAPKEAWLAAYPVGSLYLSLRDTSPEALFGGRWERLKDVFLLAAGDKFQPGSTGGEESHLLTEEELPAHSHTVPNVRVTGSDTGLAVTESFGGGTGSRKILTSTAGSSKPHNNMPPYLAVYVWQRLEDAPAV